MICNYCSMQAIERTAKRSGLIVVKQLETQANFAGTRVMTHPPEEELDHDKHFVAWFARLPKECVCQRLAKSP